MIVGMELLRHTTKHAQHRTESKPSTPPALRPFNPDMQTLSLLGPAAIEDVAGASAIAIWSMAVAWLVTVTDACLAAYRRRRCIL